MKSLPKICSIVLALCLSIPSISQVNITVNEPAGTIVAEVDVNPTNPPPYHFIWSTSDQIIFEETNQVGTSGIIGEDFRNYCVVVINKKKCEAKGCFSICPELTENIIITHASTEDPFGSVQIVPKNIGGPNLYEWNTININGPGPHELASGTYSVTITNEFSGCTQIENIYIKECGELSPPIEVQLENSVSSSTHCASDGAISINVIGGTPPYSYLWTSGDNGNFTAKTQNLENISTANYCVTVSDHHCQIATFCHIIYPKSNIPFNLDIQLSTVSNCLRAIDLEVSGGTLPYQYLWNNGSTVPEISALNPGEDYHVIVTDASGCEEFRNINVGFPDEIEIHPDIQGTCQGASNGYIKLSVANAISPLNIIWNTGQTTKSINNLAQGTYSVTIEDLNNCVISQDFEIESNVVVSADVTDACLPIYNKKGSIVLNTSGGMPPYNYNWSPNVSNNHQALNIEPDSYQITITDNNNCFREVSHSVNNLEFILPEWKLTSTTQYIRQAFLEASGILVLNYVKFCDQAAYCENNSQLLGFNGSLECSQNGFNWFSCPCVSSALNNLTVRCQFNHDLVEDVYYLSTLVDGPYEVNEYCFNKLYCLYQGSSGLFFMFEGEEEIPCNNLTKQINPKLSNPGFTKENNLKLNISPNPFKEIFSVEVIGNRSIGNGQFEIFDAQGKSVFQKRISLTSKPSQIFELNFDTALPSGIYLLQLTNTTGKTAFHKIIPKK